MSKTNLKEQVQFCLEQFEETRNSDIALMIKIWETYYPDLLKEGTTGEVGVWLKDLYSLPREDNIKRIRAVFQNDFNQYLPTDPIVRKKRRIEEEKWLQFIRVQTEHKRI